MPDRFPASTRSRIMKSIRGKNTSPELTVRSYLHRKGFRFRIHCARLPGHPDIVLPRYGTVVFVHGCFWHQHPGCKHSGVPTANAGYWRPKLEKTVARDRMHHEALVAAGWHVETIWECQISEETLEALASRIAHHDGC